MVAAGNKGAQEEIAITSLSIICSVCIKTVVVGLLELTPGQLKDPDIRSV